jgi:hypothetical protein
MNLIELDNLSPHLNRILAQARSPRAVIAAVGKRLEVDLRAHFEMLDSAGNKHGWPRKHFWNRQVRARTALTELSARGAVVTISSPELLQKIYGGTITPKRGKALAIPLNAQAYKAGSPRELNDPNFLKYVPLNRGRVLGLLVRRIQIDHAKIAKGKKNAITGGEAWYLLMRSITQPPQENALPDQSSLEADLYRVADEALSRQLSSVR